MTNFISDILANTLNQTSETRKTQSYQTKETEKSFSDIFENVNSQTSKIEESKIQNERLSNQNERNNTLVKNDVKENSNLKTQESYKKQDETKVSKEERSQIDNSTQKEETAKVQDNSKTEPTKNSTVKKETSEPKNDVSETTKNNDAQQTTGTNEKVTDQKDSQESDTLTIQTPVDSIVQETSASILETALNQTETVIDNTVNTSNEQTNVVNVPEKIESTEKDTTAISEQSNLKVDTTIEINTKVAATQTADKPLEAKVSTQNESNKAINPEQQNKQNSITQTEDEKILESVLAQVEEAIQEEPVNNISIKVSSTVEQPVQNNIKTQNQEPETKPETELQQSMLDEMDAEVTDMSQNSSGNNFTQQNATDQIVKFSIEPMAKTEQTDFSAIVNKEVKPIGDKVSAPINTTTVNAKELSKVDILNQINEKFAHLKSNTSEKLEIILKPEHLGKVNLEIQSTKGLISATLVASSQQVKELLEKNIESLKNNLNAQGLNVNNINVKVEETNKSAFNDLNFNQQFEAGTNNEDRKNNSFLASESYGKDIELENSMKGLEEGITQTQGDSPDMNSLRAGLVDYKV